MRAPQLTRQQRRKIRRDLTDRGHKFVQRGLPERMEDNDRLAVALVLRESFDAARDTYPASALAAAAENMLERTLAIRTKSLPLACAKGCSWCCRCFVTCSPPEIFRIAYWLRDNADARRIDTSAIAAEADRRRPLSETDLFKTKPMCALLTEGACGVYDVRPLPCRALLSLSEEACRAGIMENRGQIPLVTTAMDSAEQVRILMLATVRSVGLSDAGYELVGGLAAALAGPDTEQRWLAGEDVFAGVRRGPRSQQHRAIEDRIAADINVLVDS